MAVADENVVVQYHVSKRLVKKVDEYRKRPNLSRSRFLAILIETCLEDKKMFRNAIMDRIMAGFNKALYSGEKKPDDGEKMLVQAVLARSDLQDVDAYGKSVGLTRAGALSFLTELSMDEQEFVIDLVFSKPGMKVVDAVRASKRGARKLGTA